MIYLKSLFARIMNDQLKQDLLKAVPFWIASFCTGIIAVVYAKLFALAEEWSAHVLHNLEWWLFIVAPICFLTAWWIVKRFAPAAKGSGIPQVMAAIELANPKNTDKISSLLSVRILVVKIISSMLMVVGGGVVGREGPTIQIAGTVFWKINQWLPASWPKISKRNSIMTGAAAGLAAAFNTPLGGIVFAVEELARTHMSSFKTALFTAVIIAGLTAQGIIGSYLYLGYPVVAPYAWWIFLIIILVAAISGIAGAAMSKGILMGIRFTKKFVSNKQQVIYIIICAFILASFGYFMGELSVGSGKEIMEKTLFTEDKSLPWYLPIVRMFGSIFSFTTGAAGGVFAPSLGAGASIGAVFAGWFNLSPTESNLLILSAMVAFLTGLTRTPFTSAILVLEMTDRHSVIFQLMLAGMVANLIAKLIDRKSFYDHLKEGYLKDAQAIPPPADFNKPVS